MDAKFSKDKTPATEDGTGEKKTAGVQHEDSSNLPLMMSLINAHQHNLGQIEAKFKELIQNQQVLVEGLRGENDRFKEAEATFNLPGLFSEVSVYTQKLSRLKGEMNNITERTARLKRRAMHIQQQQQQKALNHEQQRAELAEREKHLIARPVWAAMEDER